MLCRPCPGGDRGGTDPDRALPRAPVLGQPRGPEALLRSLGGAAGRLPRRGRHRAADPRVLADPQHHGRDGAALPRRRLPRTELPPGRIPGQLQLPGHPPAGVPDRGQAGAVEGAGRFRETPRGRPLEGGTGGPLSGGLPGLARAGPHPDHPGLTPPRDPYRLDRPGGFHRPGQPQRMADAAPVVPRRRAAGPPHPRPHPGGVGLQQGRPGLPLALLGAGPFGRRRRPQPGHRRPGTHGAGGRSVGLRAGVPGDPGGVGRGGGQGGVGIVRAWAPLGPLDGRTTRRSGSSGTTGSGGRTRASRPCARHSGCRPPRRRAGSRPW